MFTEVSNFKRENFYTYNEAAAVIKTTYSSLANAANVGIFTVIKIPRSRIKYIPKCEVDILAGSGSCSSKEARAKVDAVRYPGNVVVRESLDNYDAREIRMAVRDALRNELPSIFPQLFNSFLDSLKVGVPR